MNLENVEKIEKNHKITKFKITFEYLENKSFLDEIKSIFRNF